MRLSPMWVAVSLLLGVYSAGYAQELDYAISEETEECLGCHTEIHPGLVASWQKSRHSKVKPSDAIKVKGLTKRVSSSTIPETLSGAVVGCYECHGLRTENHDDSFEHNSYQINVIVSPDDCKTCHIEEVYQYSKNIMAHAYGNLVNNSLYRDFTAAVNNNYNWHGKNLEIDEKNMLTEYESCLYCHGTKVEVKGLALKETDYGDYEFPILEGWPNQGVGRVNPDGSKGSCSACHSRHSFSIEMARKPYTCSECHKGPDVPAYKVYEVSKHGNIFNSLGGAFDFNEVPWVVGEDFTAPTCAACHASLLVTPDETVIAKRTHQYNDRLSWRLFGVPYSHPHPIDANLDKVANSEGLPLPVELDGKPVKKFTIDPVEQELRNDKMKAICASCHSTDWIEGHFSRLKNTIARTNDITNEGTKILMKMWEEGQASGLPQKDNIFDEEPERIWTSIWLFYANSTRFASAMAGGGDYGVFANGRYQTTEQLYRLDQLSKRKKSLESVLDKR